MRNAPAGLHHFAPEGRAGIGPARACARRGKRRPQAGQNAKKTAGGPGCFSSNFRRVFWPFLPAPRPRPGRRTGRPRGAPCARRRPPKTAGRLGFWALCRRGGAAARPARKGAKRHVRRAGQGPKTARRGHPFWGAKRVMETPAVLLYNKRKQRVLPQKRGTE